MPEEQAFCVLVNIMYQYGLRNLFRQGFEELHLRFYQLERLIQVTLLHSTEKVMFLKKLFRLLGFWKFFMFLCIKEIGHELMYLSSSQFSFLWSKWCVIITRKSWSKYEIWFVF